MSRRGLWALGILTVVLASGEGRAIEVGDGKLSINAFGGWAYGRTFGSPNSFGEVATPEGSYQNANVALTLSSRLIDRVVVSTQLYYAMESGFSIDWAFGEYRFSDQLRVRGGIIKNPFGLFAETHDVGTLRPFYLLPSGIYGPSKIAGESVLGASLAGTFRLHEGWELAYDLYFGALAATDTSPYEKLLEPDALVPGGTITEEEAISTEALGGRLVLSTPVDGLTVRVSGYGVPSHDPTLKGLRWVVGPSVEYLTESFSARAEYLYHRDYDLASAHAAYLEVAYFLTQRLQVAARGELYASTLLREDTGSSSLLFHRELAASVNLWAAPGLVFKLSFHAIDGNRFAQPESVDQALLDGTLQRGTSAVIFGTQFSL